MRLLKATVFLAMMTAVATAQPADGENLFRHNWTAAETASDGLGPLYNEASCNACHWLGGGARVRIRPDGEVAAAGLLVRVTNAQGQPDPHYGVQVQNKAVTGLLPEAVVSLRALQQDDDLTRFVTILHRRDAQPLSPGHVPSVRMAPALDAAGLAEQASDASILTGADPDDADADGISGRAHMVRLPDGSEAVGRFNWKATQPLVATQVATAFHFDMGLGSSLYSGTGGDCTPLQTECRKRAGSYGTPDITDQQIGLLAGFVRSLGSRVNETALPPAASFMQAGCGSCHVPHLDGGSGQAVPLYSNLLLHDMGEGLSSQGGEGDASAREWRTTPLVGFRGHLPGHRYLHDGRAANIDEAIRWHGGEATAARQAYMAMSASQKLELTAFVQALLTSMPLPAGLASAN